MAYDPQQYALLQSKQPSQSWLNRCQQFVRTALGFQAGVPGGGSAREEYQYTKAKGNISTGTTPPPNVPVYFDTKGNAGHVALSAGGGYAWTTDMAGPGTVSLQKISDIAGWAGPYLGYGESEGDSQLVESGGNGSSLIGKLGNGLGLFLDPLGAVPGHTSVGSIPGLGALSISKDVGGAIPSVAGATGGLLGDIGSGIASGLKAVFTGEFFKRLMAAIVGGLLILMALWKLSGVNAVPIPV